MKKVAVFISILSLIFSHSVLAKKISLNEMMSSTTTVNTSALSKTSSNGFNEDCVGSGKSMSGRCVIEYEGATYFGDVKYGEPNGSGIQYWENNSYYIGEWKNGFIDGYGGLVWEDGTYFQGLIEPAGDSSGIIFVNNLDRPTIYIGEVEPGNITSRSGYGVQYFYQPGVQHEITSEPIESYATYFTNNLPASVNCIRGIGESFYYGSCNDGNGPRDFNFRNKSGDPPKSFVDNLERVLEASINNFDQAEQIANQTYEVAFGEEIFERSERSQPKTQIAQDETPQRIQLVPVEAEYVAIKNANVRQEPYVGSPVVLTIKEGTIVYVPGKVKGEDWLAIEGENGIIGYSYGTLYMDKQEYAKQQDSLQQQIEDIAQAIKDEEPQFFGSGTGFFVTDTGHIVTNQHVTHGCEYMLFGEEQLKVLRNDVANDLAVLKSENKPSNYLRISSNITPLKGEDVLVLGYPYGKLTSSESKVTKGIVSALQGLGNNFTQFQIDAAIQPGNSGGPVFNSNGALVGVTVATADYKFYEENFKSLPQNMNFAIKSIMLENFLASTGISYDKENVLVGKSQPEIVQAIDNATVYLECWSTEERFAEAERGVNILVDTVRAEKAKSN
mgnify:CR=1 FL=1